MKRQLFRATLFSMIFTSFFMGSCNADQDADSLKNPKDVEIENVRLSEEQILLRAEEALFLLDNNTRSVRTVKSVVPIVVGNGMTRSSEMPSYYLVNYDNDNGFALVNAYKNGVPVYAFSDKGALNLCDTTFNKGLATYIGSLPLDPAVNYTGADPNPPSGPDSVVTETIKTLRTPLLSDVVQDWDQRKYPMKSASITSSNACCVAVATLQIMSFYECPKSYEGVSIDWTGIKNGTNTTQTHWLIEQLGLPKNLDVINGGCIPEYTLNRTLKAFGYNDSGNWLMASSNSITSNMYVNHDRRPMWCQIPVARDNTGAVLSNHVFSCDGFLSVVTRSYASNRPDLPWIDSDNTYLHIVWGYGKNANGYFLWDKNLGGDAYQWDTPTPEKWGPFYGLKYITGMIPK